jgi:PAS domain-containing protein
MLRSIAVADEILRMVSAFVSGGDRTKLIALDIFPAALYVTDPDGFLTYFNPACVEFAGRRPRLGWDRWCVTWKLYTDDGTFLPHDHCPMAVAIQTGRAVRGITAVAERPDNTRISFLPFPTPVTGRDGEVIGAVNMLFDISDRRPPAMKALYDDLRAWLGLLVEQALADFSIEDVRCLANEIEDALAWQKPRVLH